MRILGIDPGTATTGFGVVEYDGQKLSLVDGGVISTSSDMAMPDRLEIIYRELSEVIAEFRPEVMSVEQLYFATNVTTAISVGQARGVILLCAAEAKLKVMEFSPPQVKMAVTGYGKATKAQIQEMVKTLLKLTQIPKPDDAADALAVAIAAAQSGSTIEQAVRR